MAGANFKGSADPMGRIFEVRSGRLVRELAGHAESLIGIQFSPDGQLIATASGDSTVKVWPVQAGAPALDLEGHDQPVWTVSFSPNQRYLATGSFDGTAKDLGSRNRGATARPPRRAFRCCHWPSVRAATGWQLRALKTAPASGRRRRALGCSRSAAIAKPLWPWIGAAMTGGLLLAAKIIPSGSGTLPVARKPSS